MKLIAFVVAVLVTFASFGSNDADSVKVYFRAGQRQFDPTLGENREKMDRFMQALNTYVKSDIESIVVRSYTSPDGTSSFNETLARQRCDSIAAYIVANSGLSRSLIHTIPEGIAWNALLQLVKQDPRVPDRGAVLDILENTPVWVFDANGKVVDGRKSRLMSLDRGLPYNWMLKNLFPQLRNAVAISVVMKSVQSKASEPSEKSDNHEPCDSNEIYDDSCPMDSIQSSELSDPFEPTELSEPSDLLDNSDSFDSSATSGEMASWTEDHFAVKTNLLYYAVLMPNLEVEWRFSKRWSVALEGDVAWYGRNTSFHKYRIAIVTPEVRYRVRPREAWRGLYVGVFIGPGVYDLENGGNGYRGEGVMTGVSLGYSWPIARRLSLEAALGVGYLYTRYKEYKPFDGHFLYQRTKDLNYFGPLKLKLSLVWRFGHRRAPLIQRESVI
ncbi:MAG: DUF3575 domain-containing protein [Muribaculaceae bacterium]|nr:DUF3575 domain-containing protein [Muribaculaceae bacterium]